MLVVRVCVELSRFFGIVGVLFIIMMIVMVLFRVWLIFKIMFVMILECVVGISSLKMV